MNCVVCGAGLGAGVKFCSVCGITVGSGMLVAGPGRCCPKCLTPLDPERAECAYCASSVLVESFGEGGGGAIRQPYAWMECHGGHVRPAFIVPAQTEPAELSCADPLVGCEAHPLPAAAGPARSLPQVLAVFCGVFLALLGLGAGAWLMLVGGSVPAKTAAPDVRVANQVARAASVPREVSLPAPSVEVKPFLEVDPSVARSESVQEARAKEFVSREDDRKSVRQQEQTEEYIRKMKQQLAEQLKEMHKQ